MLNKNTYRFLGPTAMLIFGMSFFVGMYPRLKQLYFPAYHNTPCEEMCTICYEEGMPQGYLELPCHHKFHKVCIVEWVRTCCQHGRIPRCPMCRHPFFYI
ncbi:MAG: hypothetical protein LBR79_04980 [Oscillospiraceae bacterium]|nr:hypothetical protein [Oscillospiraceae bacterium]